jgi:aminotransferase EvaB
MERGMKVPRFDARGELRALGPELLEAVERVLASGELLHGRETKAFERAMAASLGGGDGVAVATGTDAITLALMGLGIGPGDEVLTVANAGVPGAMAIRRAGARARFVDIDPATGLMDLEACVAAIGSKTRAVLAVHLYGNVLNVPALRDATDDRLFVVEDCAQAQGAKLDGVPVGTLGSVAAFSFYPTKNLGALGDGGMVWSADAALAERVRSLAAYAADASGAAVQEGLNSRLDEIQAAALLVKWPHLAGRLRRRRALVDRYERQLPPSARRFAPTPNAELAPHLFVVRVPRRDAIRGELRARGVDTGVHYAQPAHTMPAFAGDGEDPIALPETVRACAEVLSLPLYPQLTDAQVDYVCEQLVSLL